ncbi:tetratricopeptide repeat-containing sensor histidine kinase [Mucilaginibacter gotjawali]|uniref:Signal transduction histidine kinase n=2 Tax=Mucilaginibacter gotjawali TaxID=1550579 RepID=A0A839SI43_9SPHI|nr:ATP-binding protein [Mucilaginibacter gotjawali]MBB3056560.1 signal transduction histidine kinase [Mucilaginibacter gotjawali]BAU52737.1 Adaptive-response sensory-kinase SasA [Mucilaginibacter gotjawali]
MKKLVVLFSSMMLLSVVCYGQIDDIKNLQKQLPLIKDSLRYVDALNKLALLFYENNVDSTFAYTQLARNIAERLQYDKGKAESANNLGIVYDMKGDLELALRYYNDGYNRFKSIGDTANMVQSMMNIAMVYNEKGVDKKAVGSFKDALEAGRRLSRDSIMSLVWYNYLILYPGNFQKDSLTVYINKAKKIGEKYKDRRVLLAIEQLTADNYIKNGQRDKGLALLQQAAYDAIKNKLFYLSLDILIDLGDLFAQTDSAQAVSYYKQALYITQLKDYKVYTESITKKLYNFYTARKDTSKAFFYSQQLVMLHEERDRVENKSGIDFIAYALKDQQLEAAQGQSRYELRFLFLAVFICALMIVILVILWRNWKKLRKTSDALRLQFEQSESTMEALDVMNKNYSRLIKIVAHDLRNPISAISTISGMLHPDENLPADMKELMGLVQVSSKNCLDLINELLETDFDQRQKIKTETINPDELLQQCVSLLSFRAQDKGQQLTLNSNVQVKINGDTEKLWRVMNNLVVNAIKFSPEGSAIHIESKQIEDKLLISVNDAGLGIPEDIRNKIFDPFTSARRTGTQGEQPFGLGLYISKQIIEDHNGRIWFESVPGKGTTFYVELPVSAAA